MASLQAAADPSSPRMAEDGLFDDGRIGDYQFTTEHDRSAVANKMARIAWAIMAKGGYYRAPELAAAA